MKFSQLKIIKDVINKERISRFVKWIFWEISGLRLIWEKASPPCTDSKQTRAPSIGIWVLSLYVALFGIASQRYENAVDRIEGRANGIYSQLGSPRYLKALERIPTAQHMTTPQKPNIFQPTSVLLSFLGKHIEDMEISESLADVVALQRHLNT